MSTFRLLGALVCLLPITASAAPTRLQFTKQTGFTTADAEADCWPDGTTGGTWYDTGTYTWNLTVSGTTAKRIIQQATSTTGPVLSLAATTSILVDGLACGDSGSDFNRTLYPTSCDGDPEVSFDFASPAEVPVCQSFDGLTEATLYFYDGASATGTPLGEIHLSATRSASTVTGTPDYRVTAVDRFSHTLTPAFLPACGHTYTLQLVIEGEAAAACGCELNAHSSSTWVGEGPSGEIKPSLVYESTTAACTP